MSLTTADYALAVSFVSLVVGAVRARTAEKNNTITGSAPWAQMLMQCVQSEVGLCIRERNAFRSFFVRSFESVEAKRAARADIEKIRDESARNLEFLGALYGDGREMGALVDARASLLVVYDSYLESDELVATVGARRSFEVTYSKTYVQYLGAIRKFSLDVSTGRARLEREKRFGGLFG